MIEGTASEVAATSPNLVVLSPGPGDPSRMGAQIETTRALARQAVAGGLTGPIELANVSPPRSEEPPAGASGGRPLWPVLLALAVPSTALALTAAHAWRPGRAGAGNRRNL